MEMHPEFEILKQAYSLNPFRVTNVIRFTKQASEPSAAYPTIYGAFIFPVAGRARIQFNDCIFMAEPGIVIHGCPGCSLSFHVEGEDLFSYINIYYHQINRDLLFSLPVDLEVLLPLLEKMADENDRTDIHSVLQRRLYSEQVFQQLFYGGRIAEADADYQMITHLIAYIGNHYHRPLTMHELAQQVGRSESQLSYLFYKYVQQRPIDYVIDYRIDAAARLLREEGYSVGEAAEAVGYSDPLYFSRLFKKRTGYSPSQIK